MKRRSLSYYSLLWGFSFLVLLSSCHSAKEAEKPGNISAKTPAENENNGNSIAAKYATELGVEERKIKNIDLYSFIDSWYSTPYKYGGKNHSGIDCSGFVSILEQNIYNIPLAGSCSDIYKLCKPIKPSQLKEGDLVFFKVKSKTISHVGVYLQNNKFVHASVHSGVIISDLGTDYYKKYFWGAARLIR